MASLKKPNSCSSCSSESLRKEKDPERWICNDCETIIISRKPKPDPTKCRECDAPRGSKPFKAGKNLCQECSNTYMVSWRDENQEHWREYRSRDEVKAQLHLNTRKAVQRSPEAFIRYLSGMITKRRKSEAGQRQVDKGKLNPACLIIDIDYEYLIGMYFNQDGRCALSSLPMVHALNDLCSISVDRIDSDLGYVRGNVQLVCKWVNLGKGSSSNGEFEEILEAIVLYFRKPGPSSPGRLPVFDPLRDF